MIQEALRDIKLAHSVFALPFAVLAAFMASPVTGGGRPSGGGAAAGGVAALGADGRTDGSWGVFAGQLALVVLCMVLARTWAMLVNRLADREFDAANPRTARRAFAAGAVSTRAGRTMAAVCALGFLACCAGFWALFGNPWPLALGVPVLAWLAFYSYTKRFTALSHVVLGSSLAMSPIGAALAVRPEALADTPALWALAGMALFWVAGFDVLYALQDEAFDRRVGLRSVPARLGAARAAWLSRGFHVAAFVLLALAWELEDRFGMIWLLALILVAGTLIFEHAVVQRRGLEGLPLAFGLANGIVAITLGLAGVCDLLL